MKKSILTLALLALSCKAHAFPNLKVLPHEIVELTDGSKEYSQVDWMDFHEFKTLDFSCYRCYNKSSFGYDVLIPKVDNMLESICCLCDKTDILEKSHKVSFVKDNGVEAYIFYFEKGRLFLFGDCKRGWFQTYENESVDKDI